MAASEPTSSDNVFPGVIVSGATLTVEATAYCKSMDWSTATNNPTLLLCATINIYGSLTFKSGMTVTGTNTINFTGGGNYTLTTKGVSIGCRIDLSNSYTGTLSLGDDLTMTTMLNHRQGALTTNNHNITCNQYYLNHALTRTINLGTSTINCISWTVNDATTLTLNATTSTINCSGNFTGGGLTYGTINLTGATSTITGSNTFSALNLASGITQTITFTDGTTQTVTSTSLVGSSGHIHTLQGSSTGGWTIAKVGDGTVTAQYCVISYSTGSPADTWYYMRWPPILGQESLQIKV
jgi:hypothetical protein